jgi:glycosyltransferase involved in cell wall biosynthesis
MGASDKPVAVVRNTSHDILHLLPQESMISRDDASTSQLAYLGFLVETRGLGQVIHAASKLGSSLNIWVAGKPRDKAVIEQLSGLSNVHFLGILPRSEALAVMRDADAVLMVYDTSIEVNRMAAPNKFYEALMVGTPVICSSGMSLAKIVKERDVGFVVDYGDLDCILSVTSILGDEANRQARRKRCRELFLNQYQLKFDIHRYTRFYREIVGDLR